MNKKRRIIWTFAERLKDLDFVDDIALLSYPYRDIKNIDDVNNIVKQISLNINANKTKVVENIAKSEEATALDSAAIEQVNDFIYLGSKIAQDGNSKKSQKLRRNVCNAK